MPRISFTKLGYIPMIPSTDYSTPWITDKKDSPKDFWAGNHEYPDMFCFQKINGSKMDPYINLSHQSKNQTPTSFLWCDFSAPAGADHRKLPWRRSQMTTRFLQNKKGAWMFMGFFAVKLPSEFSQQSPRPLCVEMTWWHMGIDLYFGIDVCLVYVHFM